MMKKKLFPFLLCAVLVLSIGVVAYADYTMTYYPGPGADGVTNMPQNDYGTGGAAYTVSSTVPQRSGYEFIDWTLDYAGKTYKVTYVVNPDPTWKTPEDSTVPRDSTRYAPHDYVHVASQLTTTVGYAYNEKGEKVLGTWTFTPWDKADFEITEDTTITGGWSFEPAPATKYDYTVEYWLVDGTKLITKVAADKTDTVDALGDEVTEYAIPMGSKDLLARYRSGSIYRIKPHWETVTTKINKNNQVIYIFYEKIPKGQ